MAPRLASCRARLTRPAPVEHHRRKARPQLASSAGAPGGGGSEAPGERRKWSTTERRAPLADRVLAILARVAGPHRAPPSPGPDTPLAEGGFWLDSAGLFEAVLACEAEFDVRFDGATDLGPDQLMTVATLIETIRGHIGRAKEPDGP